MTRIEYHGSAGTRFEENEGPYAENSKGPYVIWDNSRTWSNGNPIPSDQTNLRKSAIKGESCS